jgi:hypothetical protein
MVIWLATLLLPSLLFLVGNSFGSRWVTATRALVAVLAGWSLNFAYANIAQAVTARSSEDINGAAFAFAAVLGWVPATAVVLVTWAAVVAAKRRLRPNKAFKPTSLRDAA